LKGVMRDLRGYHGGQMKPTNIPRTTVKKKICSGADAQLRGTGTKEIMKKKRNRNCKMDLFVYKRKKC
jgi:hypothetical protein